MPATRARGPTLVDAAVRAAASLTLEFARLAGCGLLLPGEQRVTAIDRELSTWPARDRAPGAGRGRAGRQAAGARAGAVAGSAR